MTDWEKTAVDESDTDSHSSFDDVSHITKLEAALSAVKIGCLIPRLEMQNGNPLTGTDIEIVWFSPNDWQNYRANPFGCVAFEFDFDRMISEYGQSIYALGVANATMGTSRILLSNSDRSAYFPEYDNTAQKRPWTKIAGHHIHRRNCVLHVAVDAKSIALDALSGIRFVDQKHGTQSGGEISASSAARLFLSRLVGEQLPPIRGFCGVNEQGGLHHGFEFAARSVLNHAANNYAIFRGVVRNTDEVAIAFARAVLDRSSRLSAIGPYGKTLSGDAHAIAGQFASKYDLMASLKRALVEWGQIEKIGLLND